jgi:hypothetical protein
MTSYLLGHLRREFSISTRMGKKNLLRQHSSRNGSQGFELSRLQKRAGDLLNGFLLIATLW